MRKWNWNNPITWRQSIICSGIGLIISVISIVGYWMYMVGKLDDLIDGCKKLTRKMKKVQSFGDEERGIASFLFYFLRKGVNIMTFIEQNIIEEIMNTEVKTRQGINEKGKYVRLIFSNLLHIDYYILQAEQCLQHIIEDIIINECGGKVVYGYTKTMHVQITNNIDSTKNMIIWFYHDCPTIIDATEYIRIITNCLKEYLNNLLEENDQNVGN